MNDSVIADTKSKKENMSEVVLMVEIISGRSLVEYHGGEDTKFLKITMALPNHIAPAKRLLETTTVYESLKHYEYKVFEANVDIDTR